MTERRLFLIGGSAGAGKSTAAKTLAKELGAGWLQIDTLWIALQDALPPDSPPGATLRIDERVRRAQQTAEELVQAHVEASTLVCAALPRALEFELETHGAVVADGAWLLPRFMANLRFEDTAVAATVIHETSRDEVQHSMLSRRAVKMVAPWHALGAEVSWRYGNYLAEEAGNCGIPMVAALPRETLFARLKTALGA